MSRRQELVRFAAIGVVNTGVYYLLFVVLHLALPYLAAHVVAFAGAVVGSFLLNCRFTFQVRPTWRRFVRFPVVNLGTFAVMTTCVTTLVELLKVAPDVAALLAAVASVPLTYVLARVVLVGHLRNRTPA